LVVVLGGLAFGLVFLPGGRVTRENCERIKEGMTVAEVRAILGKPWDDSLFDPEGPSESDMQRAWNAFSGVQSDLPRSFWMGGSLGIFVVFDGQGRVEFTVLCTDPDRSCTWLPQRVWRRLRERWGW
jgi:hypothetical protein